uniref:PNPLA domain-containing protein n=1 Tax=Strigamia maritima TaxID=126957 RepID=T1ILI3_STRMM
MKYRLINRASFTGIKRKFLTNEFEPGFNSSNDLICTKKNYNSFRIGQKEHKISAYLQQTKMKLRDWTTLVWRVFRDTSRNRDQTLIDNRPPLQAGLAPKLSALDAKQVSNVKNENSSIELEKARVSNSSAVYPNETVEIELQGKLQSPSYGNSKKQQEQDNSKTPVRSGKSDAVPTPVLAPTKPEPVVAKEGKKTDKQPLWKRAQQAWVSREICLSRTRYLMRAVVTASNPVGQITRIEDFCQHLLDNPQAKSMAVKVRGISMMLRIRAVSQEKDVKSRVNEALALLGYINPLPARGIRILTIDGGGTRGVMALEILRTFERITNQPVHRLFDFICGVSTGAILSVLLGPMKASMDECEELYKRTSCEIFNQNTWLGTGKLVFNHAFYDTNAWVNILKKNIGECPLYETTRDADCPKIATVSTIVNEPRLRAFLFRNYDYPYRHQSIFPGSYCPQLWEAVRASAAAPGYFEEYKLGDYVHQDGGILTNNPSALAIHECRHLWPGEDIQCVISLGNGRHEPQLPITSSVTTSSLKTKLLKIVDSATDTEGVHMILNDLLPPKRYYRFNPYLSDAFSLDEVRPEKFKILQNDASMYIRKNEHKIREAAVQLLESKTSYQRFV